MFKNAQSGRSMVEMLGVLAIIGVLSIGGIAGYTLAMRRHRANQILDLANKYALIIYGACQKALLDGDITELTNCNHDNGMIHFMDANLASAVDITGGSSPDIYQLSGVDIVEVSLTFEDQAICKAAQNISGAEKGAAVCADGAADDMYWLDVEFKFN